ncbi:MAG: MaoC family dehydratase N-terminal domain-containing protein [Deltaproteobacteria bacterium]|nr:MaoC family dehydratase N-terminal domain-containing protein [Deltaproteobacteria bacterium]MBW2382924.1 MaoC family dehydratase N-terminal domain-containing protein [Deltaproteobacteria bacterium]MBW2698720.1 MaoC family dehydratase N-terminal domain-containing protein [Deltaproteobacteria bacterium]
MPIDPSAVGQTGGPVTRKWTSKDALLYALGVGAGTQELRFTTENSQNIQQRVLPTFAVIIGGGGAPFNKIGDFNPAMLVHGEQGIELLGEIPPEGEVESVGKISAIWDKGKGAVVEMTSESTLVATGEPLLRTRMSAFIRGEGGFGGERGPSASFEAPTRAPDHQVAYETGVDQALLYRLSGDRNPLHSDPAFAKMGGFDKPILHGLCTYGFTGRALVNTICDGDPSRFRSMDGRFSKPVLPGDTLTILMWVDGSECTFQTKNQDGDVVIDQGKMTFA